MVKNVVTPKTLGVTKFFIDVSATCAT